MKQNLQFKKSRDLGEIITDTFTFLRHHYKTFFTVFFKHVGPLILLTTLLSAYLQYSATGLVTDFGGGDGSVSASAGLDVMNYIAEFSVVGLLNILAAVITYAMSISCVLYCIKSVIDHGEIQEIEVVQQMRQKFWAFVGASVLVFLSVLIGAIFCVIPGIYLGITLSIIFSVMVFKEMPVIDAYSYCFQLIKQNWWMTFLTLIVIGLLVGIAGTIFQLPMIIMGVIEGVSSVQSGGEPDVYFGDSWLYMSFFVISTIASYALQVITIISTALIYFNLDEFHNNTGQLEQIEELGA
jgi:hypothetical protein